MTTYTASSAGQIISLVAADDGVIENINLYPGRAELTRIFRVLVHEGENHVDIHGLPISLVDDSLRLAQNHDSKRALFIMFDFVSLRIEGLGRATICDVVVSHDDPDRVSALTSATTQVADLKRRRKELSMRISATQQSRSALETYLDTITADGTDVTSLGAIFEEHDKLAGVLDTRILDLEQEVSGVDQLIDTEKKNSQTSNAKQLTRKISITVFAQKAGKVKFNVKYRKYFLLSSILQYLMFPSHSRSRSKLDADIRDPGRYSEQRKAFNVALQSAHHSVYLRGKVFYAFIAGVAPI